MGMNWAKVGDALGERVAKPLLSYGTSSDLQRQKSKAALENNRESRTSQMDIEKKKQAGYDRRQKTRFAAEERLAEKEYKRERENMLRGREDAARVVAAEAAVLYNQDPGKWNKNEMSTLLGIDIRGKSKEGALGADDFLVDFMESAGYEGLDLDGKAKALANFTNLTSKTMKNYKDTENIKNNALLKLQAKEEKRAAKEAERIQKEEAAKLKSNRAFIAKLIEDATAQMSDPDYRGDLNALRDRRQMLIDSYETGTIPTTESETEENDYKVAQAIRNNLANMPKSESVPYLNKLMHTQPAIYEKLRASMRGQNAQ